MAINSVADLMAELGHAVADAVERQRTPNTHRGPSLEALRWRRSKDQRAKGCFLSIRHGAGNYTVGGRGADFRNTVAVQSSEWGWLVLGRWSRGACPPTYDTKREAMRAAYAMLVERPGVRPVR